MEAEGVGAVPPELPARAQQQQLEQAQQEEQQSELQPKQLQECQAMDIDEGDKKNAEVHTGAGGVSEGVPPRGPAVQSVGAVQESSMEGQQGGVASIAEVIMQEPGEQQQSGGLHQNEQQQSGGLHQSEQQQQQQQSDGLHQSEQQQQQQQQQQSDGLHQNEQQQQQQDEEEDAAQIVADTVASCFRSVIKRATEEAGEQGHGAPGYVGESNKQLQQQQQDTQHTSNGAVEGIVTDIEAAEAAATTEILPLNACPVLASTHAQHADGPASSHVPLDSPLAPLHPPLTHNQRSHRSYSLSSPGTYL
eukprot:1158131-Pelagomonas_calceolata.AAC.7